MILQRHGCEYELQFGLLFANFLKANGFDIKYDVLDSLLIAEMGTAAYYEMVEKESDIIIIIFSDNPGLFFQVCLYSTLLFLFCLLNVTITTEVIHNVKRNSSKYTDQYEDLARKGSAFD